MFEGLLEKILLAKLGKFIAGLDKDNLKVALWSGDIILENVYLKKDALLMFQLPLFLELGKIKRLRIKVPWTRLGSSPVEIFLGGLYIVVVPQEKSSWSFSEEGDIYADKNILKATSLGVDRLLSVKIFLQKRKKSRNPLWSVWEPA